MPHIPILRAGNPYRSLTVKPVNDFRTGEPLAELSQANPGLIARDFARAPETQAKLAAFSSETMLEICAQAANFFAEARLPVGEDSQSPLDYVRQVSATTGMPEVMCRNNMVKITTAMRRMREVLQGLTRMENLEDINLEFRRESDTLAAILPNNSPGVHSLWLPALAMRIPVVLKPGSQEPWTPYRICQAFIRAGMPAEAFSYYPTDVNGTREILIRSGKSMFFGDARTVESWKGEARIQIHGPGWSKVVLGADKAPEWSRYLDLMVDSIAANGGRSCINASGVWTASHGRELAEGLARKMAAIEALPMDHPEARLSAFANKKLAEMISRRIDAQIDAGGAEDLTAKYRGDRLVEVDGCTFLLPTLVWCERADHPLASAEYLFPFCSVVELPSEEIPRQMGPTLVASVLSEDENLIETLFASNHIDRINAGPLPTTSIRWDQPHEGNLFELLYHQRAVQFASFAE